MRDNRRSRTWLSWLTVTVLAVMLVSGFVLMGGLSSGDGSVALARSSGDGTTTTASSSTVSGPTSSTGVVSGINTTTCAGPTLAGTLILNEKLTGQVTLGLFALSQHPLPLARRFNDTGQRVSVSFDGTTVGSFVFPVVPGGAVDYFVAVVTSSGPVIDASQLVESAVLPVCGTHKATVTTTATVTVTTTTTSTDTVTSSGEVVQNANDVYLVTSTSTASATDFITTTSTTTVTSTHIHTNQCYWIGYYPYYGFWYCS
jgi:hypothetical protein